MFCPGHNSKIPSWEQKKTVIESSCLLRKYQTFSKFTLLYVDNYDVLGAAKPVALGGMFRTYVSGHVLNYVSSYVSKVCFANLFQDQYVRMYVRMYACMHVCMYASRIYGDTWRHVTIGKAQLCRSTGCFSVLHCQPMPYHTQRNNPLQGGFLQSQLSLESIVVMDIPTTKQSLPQTLQSLKSYVPCKNNNKNIRYDHLLGSLCHH